MSVTKDLRLRIPEALKDKLELIASDMGCSVNAWAVRVLAQGARNHIPLEEFINQAPMRGQGKARRAVGTGLSVFHGLEVNKLGWPDGLSSSGHEAEIRRAVAEGDGRLMGFMQRMWNAAELGEYTAEHMAETKRALA